MGLNKKTMFRKLGVFVCVISLPLAAQAPPTGPVVPPRGVINAFTQQPAPSMVAPGGLIWIQGLNLGPAGGLKATNIPWPVKLGDIEVLVNDRPSPVGSISPGTIVAQVPVETAAGLADVVVRMNGATSRPARIQVVTPNVPSLRTADNSGYGDAAGIGDTKLSLSVSGLGVTDPQVNSGEAGSADTPVIPKAQVRAYVGGLPANTTAVLSPDRVGEFDVKIDVPTGATPGDIITVLAGNRAANQVTWKRTSAADVSYLPLPDGTPDIRSIESTDLRGMYVVATGARDDNGCYAAWTFDMAKKSVAQADPCLTAANRNAISPVVSATNTSTLAAFIGPAPADATAGISTQVKLLSPVMDPLTVQLPAAASLLASAAGNLIAVLPGTPPSAVSIDTDTGDVQPVSNANIGGFGGGGGAGNVPGVLQIDLGNGINNVVSTRMQLAQGTSAVVVVDDVSTPTAAKVALVNNQNQVAATMAFPDGWLPVMNPDAPAQTGPGGFGGNGGGIPAAFRAVGKTTTLFDSQTRVYYVLGRKTDDSKQGFVAFSLDNTPASVRELPAGWFAASCTTNVRVLQLTLSRQIAIFGTNAVQNTFKNPCAALGFLIMDLGSAQAIGAVKLQGEGQANVSVNAGDLNDYLYAGNTARPLSDTVYVLDGVSGQSFRLDPPANVNGFSNITEVPELGILVGLATNQQRTPGDAGFVIFDIDQQQTRMLPTPDGFGNVQLLAVMNATRKLVAKGIKADGSGSQFLIYDLKTGDLQMPANPPGVAFVGTLPGATAPGSGGPGGGAAAQVIAQRVNRKANTVEAICYSADRKQTGLMVLRVN